MIDAGASTSQSAQDDTSPDGRYTHHTQIKELAESISEEYGERGLYLDENGDDEYRNFLFYVEEKDGNIKYRPLKYNGGRYNNGIVVPKRVNGKLIQYNTGGPKITKAVNQLRTTLRSSWTSLEEGGKLWLSKIG